MALVLGTKTNNRTNVSTTSLTFSATMDAGENGYMIVSIGTPFAGGVVSSMTYAGITMTLIDSRQSSTTLEYTITYALANPPIGSNSVTVNWSISPGGFCSTNAMSVTGCGGFGNKGFTNTGAGSNSVAITISKSSAILTYSAATNLGSTITIGGNSTTLDWNDNVSIGQFFGGSRGNLSVGSVTTTNTTIGVCSIIAIEILQAGQPNVQTILINE